MINDIYKGINLIIGMMISYFGGEMKNERGNSSKESLYSERRDKVFNHTQGFKNKEWGFGYGQ